jgi:hypothetical protein
MSNIIAFQPATPCSRADNLTALVAGVAQGRRRPDDVFWLKENAELLGVLAATKEPIDRDALAPFEEFYDQIEEKLRFYPQYYRFFLSICLDREDLGFVGTKGETLCNWAAAAGLAQAELSDLQRAEACRLLARRGASAPISQGDLGPRLSRFVERAATFTLPNKKAAYELTHIIFYLSEYGANDLRLSKAALTSLEFAGVLAYLDQNHDLLAEVCTALRFAGVEPNEIWTDAVARAHKRITPSAASDEGPSIDSFHTFLVTGWAQAVRGAPSFEHIVPEGPLSFVSEAQTPGVLRPLSECLYELGPKRRSDWTGMRARIVPYLEPESQDILERAEASTNKFDAFFEGFARASSGLVPMAS